MLFLFLYAEYFRYVYWGEYPASFAACLGQEDCYRLILAKGADPGYILKLTLTLSIETNLF